MTDTVSIIIDGEMFSVSRYDSKLIDLLKALCRNSEYTRLDVNEYTTYDNMTLADGTERASGKWIDMYVYF